MTGTASTSRAYKLPRVPHRVLYCSACTARAQWHRVPQLASVVQEAQAHLFRFQLAMTFREGHSSVTRKAMYAAGSSNCMIQKAEVCRYDQTAAHSALATGGQTTLRQRDGPVLFGVGWSARGGLTCGQLMGVVGASFKLFNIFRVRRTRNAPRAGCSYNPTDLHEAAGKGDVHAIQQVGYHLSWLHYCPSASSAPLAEA